MKLSSTPQTPPEVGATLQKMRLERNLTLEDLSRAAGVSKSMLSQIEREKANPTIAVAWRLANALGIGIGELLSAEKRPVDAIRVLEAHELPTLPGDHGTVIGMNVSAEETHSFYDTLFKMIDSQPRDKKYYIF